VVVKKRKESPNSFLSLARELYKDGNVDGSFEVINEGLLKYPEDITLKRMFQKMIAIHK